MAGHSRSRGSRVACRERSPSRDAGARSRSRRGRDSRDCSRRRAATAPVERGRSEHHDQDHRRSRSAKACVECGKPIRADQRRWGRYQKHYECGNKCRTDDYRIASSASVSALVKQIHDVDPTRAKELRRSLYTGTDWEAFIQNVDSAYEELVISKTDEDLHLNETWFIRYMRMFNIAFDAAHACWEAGEDENGTKLRCVKEDGEVRLILPGISNRSVARDQRVRMRGKQGAAGGPSGAQGSGNLLMDRMLQGLGGGGSVLGGASRRGRSTSPEAAPRSPERRSRSAPRPAVVATPPAAGRGFGRAGSSRSATDVVTPPPAFGGFRTGASVVGAEIDNEAEVQQSDEEDDEQQSKGKKTEIARKSELMKEVMLNEARIRDAPSVFEESAGLYHIQSVAEQYVEGLIEHEKVFFIFKFAKWFGF